MIRNALILLNLFIFILYQLIFGEVAVHQEFPEKVAPGESFEVKLTIEKGDVSGSAKLEQELPKGFTAKAGRTNDASFTFSDGVVKYIWMSMPDSQSFSVSYFLTAPGNEEGSFLMEGDFVYLEGNSKQTIPIENKNLIVSPALLADNSETTDNSNITTTSQQAEVTCERIIDKSRLISHRELTVTVRINKSNVTGFARVMETMPAGFTPEEMDKGTAAYSFVDNQVKFVWMSIPKDPVVEVKYRIKVDPEITGEYLINGEFSYLVDNETRKCDLNRESIILTSPAVVEDATEAIVDEEIIEEPEQPEVAVVEEEEEPEPEPEPEIVEKITTPPVVNIPPPTNGIQYKVQIAAARKMISENYFRDHLKINENITAEMHNGWNKYTLGGFDTYGKARDKRNETTRAYTRLKGPFVTAYNNGERITVQEALMISGQKWIK